MNILNTLKLVFSLTLAPCIVSCEDPDYTYDMQPSHADAASYVFFKTAQGKVVDGTTGRKLTDIYSSLDALGLDERSFVRIFGSETPYPTKIEVYPCQRNPAYSYSPRGYKNHGIEPINVIEQKDILKSINLSFIEWDRAKSEHILYREDEAEFKNNFLRFHIFVYYPAAVFEMALFQNEDKFYLSKSRSSLAFEIEPNIINAFFASNQ